MMIWAFPQLMQRHTWRIMMNVTIFGKVYVDNVDVC